MGSALSPGAKGVNISIFAADLGFDSRVLISKIILWKYSRLAGTGPPLAQAQTRANSVSITVHLPTYLYLRYVCCTLHSSKHPATLGGSKHTAPYCVGGV